MKSVYLISLGCPKNQVDSEIMLGLLEKAGYRLVSDPKNADLLIVNTCSFIEDAKKESVKTILDAARYKVKGRLLVVAGCLPQRYKDEIAKLFPEVDLFVGTGEYQNIVEILKNHPHPQPSPLKGEGERERNAPALKGEGKLFAMDCKYIHSFSTPRRLISPAHSVYIKIAEGCFHGCSFCIIPKIRGKFRSRTIDDIVCEARNLVQKGARELILIAQDTTSYGVDLKNGSDLAKLIRKIGAIDGDFWIRIMYAYPTSITEEFINEVANNPKVCKYLDMPIQHINDKVLKAMRRKEKESDIRRLVSQIRTKIPDVVLRTSLITGFLGEGKKEFKELLDFVKEGHFDHVGAFTYSKEEGTSAALVKGGVSRQVKEDRKERLLAAQADVSLGFNKKMVGKQVRVLVNDLSESIISRTQGQALEIDGVTTVGRSRGTGVQIKVGEFVDVEIIGANEYDLNAKVC